MFEELRTLFKSRGKFTDKELDLLLSKFSFRQVPKKYRLVDEGDIGRELYFIIKGAIRLYYLRKDQEFTGYIFLEHLFASSYESLTKQQPSEQILETIEDCELLVIKGHDFLQLMESLPEMNSLVRKTLEERFTNAQRILARFVMFSPEERYRDLLTHEPELINRIPHHIIASYLGMTPVSLSRIRRRILGT